MELNDDDFIDDQIKSRVKDIEKSYPSSLPHQDKLWELIQDKRKCQRMQRARRTWAIAASIIGLISAISVWQIAGTGKDKYKAEQGLIIVPTLENEALEYINRLCKGNNISCSSSAFKELQQELNESQHSLADINKQLVVFGSDPHLLRAKTRIENHQARVIKAMVQIL